MAPLEAARRHLGSLLVTAGNVNAGLAELYDRVRNTAEPRKEDLNQHRCQWDSKIVILNGLFTFPAPENTNIVTRPLRARQINHYDTACAYVCPLADATKTLIELIERTSGKKKTSGGFILRNLEAFKDVAHINNTVYNDTDRFISAYVGMLQTAYLRARESRSA